VGLVLHGIRQSSGFHKAPRPTASYAVIHGEVRDRCAEDHSDETKFQID
jgi:hypothetical protein